MSNKTIWVNPENSGSAREQLQRSAGTINRRQHEMNTPYLKNSLSTDKNETGEKMSGSYINKNLSQARIKPLVTAYAKDENLRTNILNLLMANNMHYASDLEKLQLNFINTQPDVINFLNWLAKDQIAIINQEFKQLLDMPDRNRDILELRANAKTLATAGEKYGITRERVSQIELKYLSKFKDYVEKLKPHYIFQAFEDNEVVLTNDKILLDNELQILFTYSLKASKIKEALWLDSINGFIIGDTTWVKHLSEYIKSMPDMFASAELGSYAEKAMNNYQLSVDICLVSNIIKSHYYHEGKVSSKNRLKRNDIYRSVLERYYPNGIKLFDDTEMISFRENVKEIYGDVDLPVNNRAICVRIAEFTVLCGRGKYILPGKDNCSDKILNEIYQFIKNNKRDAIMFRELFEKFKLELLEETNVNNHFYLQGVLKYNYKYGQDFVFTKDLINNKGKGSNHDIKRSVCEFIEEKKTIVTKNEITDEFSGITEAILWGAIANNPKILRWEFGKYLHANNLAIDHLTVKKLQDYLDSYTAQGPVSTHKLYKEICLDEEDFPNIIKGQFALFSVLNYLFPEYYEFSRPYIAPKSTGVITFQSLIREHLLNRQDVNIPELIQYIRNIKAGSISISRLFDQLSDTFIRVDEITLLRKERINITDDKITIIEDVIIPLLGSRGYSAVSHIEDYSHFPDIGVEWTPYLLCSVVKYYCKRLKVINTITDYRRLHEVILSSILNIEDYDQLLKYALNQNDNAMTLEEIKKYIQEQR